MITVYARGEVTRAATPGDHVSICGVYLPIQRQGFAAISQVCLVAIDIIATKKLVLLQLEPCLNEY